VFRSADCLDSAIGATAQGGFVQTLASAILLCVLAGCAGAPPQGGYSVCSTQPGTYACQIEQYQNVGF